MDWRDVIKMNQINMMKVESRNIVVCWDYVESGILWSLEN